MKEYLEKCPKNAPYRSKTIQNELINICGQVIQKEIVDEIREGGGIFAVLADEAVDESNTKQLPLALRFVDMER
ncbi:52 kDa repressor of the inhibitor of the protein kinase-like 1 [Homarus americanus]|uniref:52 kDa repressor of the inhibitor of the protein kinase-like 1 n=1 Tax=Homarus americanus TaxID=6706 RepID=A0A8J5TGC1_HOMAM|nr:52 kDa repressor of the inhibitor of the protein kinase-like 1 [Homarus americanus]